MSKKLIAILSVISLCIGVTGCTSKKANNNETSISSESIENINANITLGENISVEGNGVVVEENKVIINSAGTYSISGTLSDGQIIVNAGDEDNVELILNGVNISCSNSSAIYVKNSKNTYIILADGTENQMTDGENYVFDDESTDEPNATIFSKSDLFINGAGSLIVNANYNNGITSKDDLEIGDANISVTSVHDGIRGKDSITITSGNITINSQGDGMKSNNAEDAERGYVLIQGGTINITSGEDGIQAETNVTITGGDITIKSGGGSENSSKASSSWGTWGNPKDFGPQETTVEEAETASAKGIKAVVGIKIDSGNIKIDSSDDSIHSNGNVEINGGSINASSGDDGIHADSVIDINDGDINISKSYEGIEAETININDGNIKLVASDDGINAAGGNDGSSMNGRPGQNSFASSGNGTINLNGGKIIVDASGDGIDANGSIYMKDGVVIVNGPEDNGNGALDYDGKFEISGGLLIAAGGAGMAQSPSTTSTQNSVNIFTSLSANTLLRVEDEGGNELITFAPSKNVQSIVISSPNIKINGNYKVYTGGESTGTSSDGLYSEGAYSGGTELESFTSSSVVTTVGQSTGGFGGPGGGRMPGQGGGMRGQEGIPQGEMPERP
ncbi:carbohydrate-binding domain-containing protein [Clostridium sp. DSM 100503]|uniref:carbohydrate-binding domain-containing protein n=1 Tax=Clostridium sp. DSM 100503 TaxID=2963282 RepID=UPI00214A7ADD|nr:carbohydrate-binding domain-containing protein [Clostridium sp. DSM 100503]MCR1950823.1 carbohydrate-binding domain-containing protein [Clostridium sp. DSM 100503]